MLKKHNFKICIAQRHAWKYFPWHVYLTINHRKYSFCKASSFLPASHIGGLQLCFPYVLPSHLQRDPLLAFRCFAATLVQKRMYSALRSNGKTKKATDTGIFEISFRISLYRSLFFYQFIVSSSTYCSISCKNREVSRFGDMVFRQIRALVIWRIGRNGRKHTLGFSRTEGAFLSAMA